MYYFYGVMLLCIVLEVNINTFPLLKSMTTEVFMVKVMFPVITLIMIIKKVFHFCIIKWQHHDYIAINDFVGDERASDVVIRYVRSYMCFTINIILHCRKAHLITEVEDPTYT